MEKINLEQARAILEKQGYILEIGYDEALTERYNVIEDAKENIITQNNFKQQTTEDAIRNFFVSKNDELEDKFIKLFDDNDAISDIFWDCIDSASKSLIEEVCKKFEYQPPKGVTKEQINEIVSKFKETECFYVLHYNTKTKGHLNYIESTTLDIAIIQYLGSEQINEYDRIELVFNWLNYSDESIVLSWKGADSHE